MSEWLKAEQRLHWEEETLEFHYPDAVDAVTDAPMCSLCDEIFPCVSYRVLQHVIALEAENARLKAQVDAAEALAKEADLFMPDGTYEAWPVFHIGNIKNGPDVVIDPAPLKAALAAYRATATEES